MRRSKRLKQIIEIKRDGVKNPTSWLFITVVEDLNLAGVTENITPASSQEALPGGGGVSHVALLNFKTSCVGVYKHLSLIVGFAVTVAIWPRKVASCHDFILCAAATFWAMSLVRIYPGSASVRAGLELGASDLQVQHPNRWATLPPVQTHIYNEVVILT